MNFRVDAHKINLNSNEMILKLQECGGAISGSFGSSHYERN